MSEAIFPAISRLLRLHGDCELIVVIITCKIYVILIQNGNQGIEGYIILPRGSQFLLKFQMAT